MSDFTEIVTANDFAAQEERIVSGVTDSSKMSFISFDPTISKENSVKAYNATVAESSSLMDNDKKKIKLYDVIIMPVTVQDNNTGVETICPRCILLCGDEVYGAVSWGVYRCLQRIQAFLGTLHFDDGLDLQIKVVKTKRGKTVNLMMV